MNKSGSNAAWNELTPEQRKTLDDWLFEENLNYKEILPRAKAELGFKGSRSSLYRYYRRRKHELLLEDSAELMQRVAEVSGAGSDVNALRVANMKLLNGRLFQALSEGPENIKEVAPLASLMIQNDRNETLRELKGEENRIRREARAEEYKLRREAMEFAKEKFQINLVEAALKALPELQELAQARKDPDTKRYEANAFMNRARRKIAGVVWEVRPESAQEEAEMLAARKAREERKQRRLEWEQREKITGHEPPTPSSPYYQEYLEWKKQNKDEDGE